jgi:hypothetical protein
MFQLTDNDLKRSILGVGDGPASFNAELTSRGGAVLSIDPIYAFSQVEIQKRVEQTYDVVIEQVRQHSLSYNWTNFANADELGRHRMATMSQFILDYPIGCAEGRYLPMQLPSLSFSSHAFDLAIVSHFLFLYSEQLTEAFHIESIKELLRVAGEVRIFPLLALNGHISPYVDTVVAKFADDGCQVNKISVDYEFQRGANQMLVLCSVN